ncbi:MAG: chemotaxis protein CheW [Acidobacteriota bacterium]
MKNDFTYINTLKGLIIFMMDNHELCANIAEVPAIIKPEELKKYFKLYSGDNKSVKQYGGSFPVINSNTFFRYETGEITSDSRMLLINCDNMIFALCAEKVLEIITLNRKNGENCLEFTPVEDDSYIKGVIHFEDKTWLLPDFIKISSELQAKLAPGSEYHCANAGRLKF